MDQGFIEIYGPRIAKLREKGKSARKKGKQIQVCAFLSCSQLRNKTQLVV